MLLISLLLIAYLQNIISNATKQKFKEKTQFCFCFWPAAHMELPQLSLLLGWPPLAMFEFCCWISYRVWLTIWRSMCGLQCSSSQGSTPVVSSAKSFIGNTSNVWNISSVIAWNWMTSIRLVRPLCDGDRVKVYHFEFDIVTDSRLLQSGRLLLIL